MEGYLKPDDHAGKVERLRSDHARNETARAARLERHSADGHRIKESPKKCGGGRHNWGTYKDDPTH